MTTILQCSIKIMRPCPKNFSVPIKPCAMTRASLLMPEASVPRLKVSKWLASVLLGPHAAAIHCCLSVWCYWPLSAGLINKWALDFRLPPSACRQCRNDNQLLAPSNRWRHVARNMGKVNEFHLVRLAGQEAGQSRTSGAGWGVEWNWR